MCMQYYCTAGNFWNFEYYRNFRKYKPKGHSIWDLYITSFKKYKFNFPKLDAPKFPIVSLSDESLLT